MSKPKGKVTVAAGTVTLRRRPGKEPQVLLVHRPAYDDWSLPKGKLEPDEYEVVAAVRETREETAASVVLRHPLGAITYPVGNGTKRVHYWLAEPGGVRKRKADKEVDMVAWVTPASALKRMTYADERAVLERALDAQETTPFLVVRHAKAMDRKHWSGRDRARPITARGRRQAARLVPLLEAYGVTTLMSSSSARCMQTLQPHARRHDLDLTGWSVLTEEFGVDHPKDVVQHMRRLAQQAAATRTPTAVCGHRPVLPTMLEGLGVPVRPFQTASAMVAHLDATGTAVAVEFHRSRW